MSDDNNGKKGANAEFNKLLAQGSAMSSMHMAKEQAERLLSGIRRMREQNMDMMIPVFAEVLHGALRSPDLVQLIQISSIAKEQFGDRDAVSALAEQFMPQADSDAQKSLEHAYASKKLAASLTVEDVVRLSRVVYSVLPDSLRALSESTGKTQAERDKRATDDYTNINSKTAAELQVEFMAKAKLFPKAALIDAISEVAGKMDIQNLNTLSKSIADSMSAAEMADFASKALTCAEEYLQNLVDDKPYNGTYSAEAQSFGPALRKTLQVIEDSVIKAGITPSDATVRAVVDGFGAYSNYGAQQKKGPGRKGPQGPA